MYSHACMAYNEIEAIVETSQGNIRVSLDSHCHDTITLTLSYTQVQVLVKGLCGFINQVSVGDVMENLKLKGGIEIQYEKPETPVSCHHAIAS